MSEKDKTSGVSIRPDSFTAEDNLLDMSLESAFTTYHHRRHEARKEDREKPTHIHCRQVIKGIAPVLKFLAAQHNVSSAEFTLCISFKVLAELQGIGVVGVVGKSYSALLASSVRDALFDDLSALESDYNISRRDGKLQKLFPVFPDVNAALEKVSDGCGTSLPKVYQIGLAAALAKSEMAADGGTLYTAVTEVFRPEIHDFLRYMARWRKIVDDGLWW